MPETISPQSVFLQFALILGLGIGAQWLAWRLRLPSILLLLIAGFIAGPVAKLLHPDELFGPLLSPLVTLSVALILYEGGLTLRFSQIREVRGVVLRLVTVGAVITWALSATAAWLVLGLPPGLSVLIGAILTVTGPTVIGPMLQHIRPAGAVGAVAKWEGIVIDPIGAMLAVLAFEALLAGSPAHPDAVMIIARTVLAGTALGFGAGIALALLIRYYLVPERLQNALSLMLVMVVTVLADRVQREAGLFAATVMGITLANQRLADVRHIVEFKENLRVLLLSSLFVILSARIDPGAIAGLGFEGALFLALLVFVIRPACVLASTARSRLTVRQRLFLCWLAPRGIVAAAVASVFALRLEGVAGSERLVSVVFLVIIATVALYGLTGSRVARLLGVADPNPQGLLIAGAHPFARRTAEVLRDHGVRVLLVDTSWHNVSAARLEGLPTHHGSIIAEHIVEDLDLSGLGRMLAMTPNDLVNSLAARLFAPLFGGDRVFQLAAREKQPGQAGVAAPQHARFLFARDLTYARLEERLERGDTIKATPLTKEFGMAAFRERYGERAVPLFAIVPEKKRVRVFTADGPNTEPSAGEVLAALIPAERTQTPGGA